MLNNSDRVKFEKMVLESLGYTDEAEKVAGQTEPKADFIPLDDEFFDHMFEPAMVKPYEMVNQPSHYMLCGSETMPMIEKILGTEGYLGFLKGSALKYRFRASKKPGNSTTQDIEKAMYMENLYDNFVRENTP